MASNQNKQVRGDINDGSFSQYLNNNNDQSMVNQLLPYMLERVPSIASSMTGVSLYHIHTYIHMIVIVYEIALGTVQAEPHPLYNS